MAAGVVGLFDVLGDNPAQAQVRRSVPGDLFYNYYTQPEPVAARMYVSPLPTPPLVGHTYITYQPLMPHEFLWKHNRVYRNAHPGDGGLTRTKVRWR